jgi:hypothetical protein
MSDHEITAGARWNVELSKQLEASGFGIVCLTPENLHAPWLLFEAGALSKSVSEARVVPFLVDLKTTDVPYPFAQFQGVTADRDGTLRLLSAINDALDKALPKERLLRIFERWWPDLEKKIQSVPPNERPGVPERSERELLEEVLSLVRDMARSAVRIVAYEAFLSQIDRELKGLYEQEYRMEFALRDTADENPNYQGLERYIAIHARLRSVLDELVKFEGYPRSKRNDYA